MRQKSTLRASSRWGASGYAGVGPSEVPFVEGSDGPRCTVNPRNTHLEELLADRIGGEIARIAEDRIRKALAVTEFDPDEVYGFMNSEEAAEFLGLPYSSFREIAPSLPRHAITLARCGYLRRELLAWGRER